LAFKKKLIVDKDYDFEQIKDMKLSTCPDCLRGRMSQFPHGETSTDDWKLFEKIAVDYKGPFKHKAIGGYNGFILFSDYYSDFIYAYPVKSKREMLDAIKTFWNECILTVKAARGITELIPKVVQSDDTTEIQSSEVKTWLNKNGITLQLSPAYRHSDNGQIERDMRNVMDKARTVMASFDVPISYWWLAIQYAIFNINISPTSKSHNKTPWEQVYNQIPDITRLVPFFIPGLYYVTKEEREPDKDWKYKAKPCRMIGYADYSSKAYDLLDLETGKIVHNRSDIVFDPDLIEEYVQTSNKFGKRLEVSHSDFNEVFGLSKMSENISLSDSELTSEDIASSDSNMENYISNYDIHYGEGAEDSIYDFIIKDQENFDKTEHYLIDEIEMEDYEDKFINDFLFTRMDKQIKLPDVPRSIEEALDRNNPDRDSWWDAINKELEQFDKYDIFTYNVPQEGHAMKTKFVFTASLRNDYTIKYKARLVVCGYSQIYGLDYKETFAPTIGIDIVFILCMIAASEDLFIAVSDVSGAFLEGKADIMQYCRLPKEISEGGISQRVQIKGNMYGEKQAPYIWNTHLNQILEKMGFTRCPYEFCLYYYSDGEQFLILSVHVDDKYIVSSCGELIHWFHEELKRHVQEVKLFEPNEENMVKYLGIDIKFIRQTKRIELSQMKYINDLSFYGDYSEKPIKIPMNPQINLRIEEPNMHNESLLPVTGKFRYLCDRTRPDILVGVGEISIGGNEYPSDMHTKTSLQIYRYLKSTSDYTLKLGGELKNGEYYHFAFSDAAYRPKKSRLGHCQFLGFNSGAIQCTSISETTISHSSCESEIKALDSLLLKVIHTRNILKFLNREMKFPTTIFIDNLAAKELCETLKTTNKTRHIQMRINFIRECINNRICTINFIRSENNVADVLTKPLESNRFNEHIDKIFNGFGGDIGYLSNIINQSMSIMEYI
jgi:hypothetical protein